MGPRPLEGTWHGVVSAALLLVARCVVHRRCGVNVTSSGTCDCAHLRRRDDVEDRQQMLSALSPAGDRASINNGSGSGATVQKHIAVFSPSDRLRSPPLFRFLLESLQRAETLGIYLLSFFTYIFARVRQQ